MGSKYSSVAVAGYNSAPPPDDGSVSESNRVKWSTHKTKIGDPLNTAIGSINTALVEDLDQSGRQITTSDSTVASDHKTTVQIASTVSTAITVSLGDAATMTNNYMVTIANLSPVQHTIGRATSGDFLGPTATNVPLAPFSSIVAVTNAAANGYNIVGTSSVRDRQADDVASAASTNLDNTKGDLVDVTGTTTITSVVLSQGISKTVRFTGILTLTHSANLLLPGAANITTAAGDFATFRGYASNVVRCTSYTKVSGATVTNLILGTEVPSTSGTTIDFTSIPSGTKRITINFSGVSTNGSSPVVVQIGDSGGIETTGYVGTATRFNSGGVATTSSVSAFGVDNGVASASVRSGMCILSLQNSSTNEWSFQSSIADSEATPVQGVGAGNKSTSAELDRVRITTAGGADTFDAGLINLILER